ncbi:hypothetical protein RHGRI_000338 [Rhododendron griersonianum]|uniref:Transmembrane protein n=1 Tax=Rhododendron griersonianum TaxID=479676 RepID=A0AAV6LID8_9ERIC|nr:hypothetical protein RHGRI_000338 [Rhododendron griersonianum]
MSSSGGGNDNSSAKPRASGGVKRVGDRNGVEIMKLLRSLQIVREVVISMSSSGGGNDNSTAKPRASGGVKRVGDGNGVEIVKLLRSLQIVREALKQVAGNRLMYVLGGFGCAVIAIGFAFGELLWMKKMKLHIGILELLGFIAALSQVTSYFDLQVVDLVLTILNVTCECASAALEQVAENRLVYVSGGFGCVVVAIGFAVGELLWMKKMKLHIGILDLLGFLAALSQVSSSGLQLVFACSSVDGTSGLCRPPGSRGPRKSESDEGSSVDGISTVYDSPTNGTSRLRRPPGSRGPRLFIPSGFKGFHKLEFYPSDSSSGDEYETFRYMDKKEI